MLAIRMQRTGRKGHAHYRLVVQDSQQTPTSGKLVATLGSYNPHTKQVTVDTEKASLYLKNGAQPSPRVVSILAAEGVTMPEWVTKRSKQTAKVRNPEKLRKHQPKAEPVAPAEEPATEAEAPAAEATPAE